MLLTIKNIIRIEQLLKKPFSKIDYTHPDDVRAIAYCVTPNAGLYDAFCALPGSCLSPTIATLETELKYIRQFTEDSGTESTSSTAYMSDLAGTLIMRGLEAHFVYNELELCDIPLFVKALEDKKKEDMEQSRLWTFYNILPHIDTKKVKSPTDIITFPWEKENRLKEAEASMAANEKEFMEFMAGKYNHLIQK